PPPSPYTTLFRSERRPRQRGEQPEAEADPDRHDRPRDRDQELRLRRRRLASDLRHATEDEQGDLGDRDPVPERDETVAQFVHQDRSEQQQRRYNAQNP